MIVADSIDAVRDAVRSRRARGDAVAFVPTMGNLHGGHLALIARARRLGGTLVASLYVNPLQFGANEDYATYPRTLDDDMAALRAGRVDILFMPGDKTMYPRGVEEQTKVEVPKLGEILEGQTRPVFFRGVTTVVNRLFNIVQPDVAVFGKKDYQQLIIIQRMVDDLAMPVEIVGVDTVREPDGLALSSRNSYLDAGERKIAPTLYGVLRNAADGLRRGGGDGRQSVEGLAAKQLETGGIRPDYVSVRRRRDLMVPDAADRALVILAAGYVGRTRLIDNIEVDV